MWRSGSSGTAESATSFDVRIITASLRGSGLFAPVDRTPFDERINFDRGVWQVQRDGQLCLPTPNNFRRIARVISDRIYGRRRTDEKSRLRTRRGYRKTGASSASPSWIMTAEPRVPGRSTLPRREEFAAFRIASARQCRSLLCRLVRLLAESQAGSLGPGHFFQNPLLLFGRPTILVKSAQ
jgi:hypothetical protein